MLVYDDPDRAAGGAVPPSGFSGNAEMRLTLFQTGMLPCPYIEGQTESRVFTRVGPNSAGRLFSDLNRLGFRRSQTIVYKPQCPSCQACVPVRVVASGFRLGRNMRRVARMNEDLGVSERPPIATPEQFDLFRRYLASRHDGGEMAAMTWDDYREMVEDTPVASAMIEFRDDDGRLIAACLTDHLDDGVSAVYSFFDPAAAARSPGTYVILWLVEWARRQGVPFVYLGYWIAESPRMSYKARFRPLERLTAEGWTPLEDAI